MGKKDSIQRKKKTIHLNPSYQHDFIKISDQTLSQSKFLINSPFYVNKLV